MTVEGERCAGIIEVGIGGIGYQPPPCPVTPIEPHRRWHRPASTVDRRRSDTLTVHFAQPEEVRPAGRIPPEWVCCAHGEPNPELTTRYFELVERGCDESSIVSAFLMAQYNPDGKAFFDKACGRYQETVDPVRRPSNWLSQFVEDHRRLLHPAGAVHQGATSRSIDDLDVW